LVYFKFKILILGSIDSGKKLLGERYLKRFEISEQDKIGVELLSKVFNLSHDTRVKVLYWNCTSNKELENLIKKHTNASKAALIWFSLDNLQSFKEVSYWINLVRSEVQSIPIMLIGDLSEQRVIFYEEARNLAENENLTGYIEVSTKNGKNISETLELLVKIIIDLQKSHQRRTSRKDLNPILRNALEQLSTSLYPDSILYEGSTYEVKKNRLILKNKGIRKIREIFGLDKFANLKQFDLSSNQIFKIKGLEMLTNLETLDLSNNKIINISGLTTLKSLKELNLSKNFIENIRGLESLSNLKSLDLSSNMIKKIKGLKSLKNLKRLKLDDNLLPQKLINELGGLDEKGFARDVLRFLEYCRVISEKFENLAIEGDKLLSQGMYELSIESLTKAIEINPDDKEVWNNIGYGYYYLDDYDKSLNAFKRALEVEKEYYYSLYNLGLIYFLKEDYGRAIKYYNKALDNDTSNLDAWYNLGLAYLRLNKFYKAIECFQVVITSGLADIDLWLNIGQAYSNIKNYEEAYHSYLQVTRINPDYKDVQQRIQLVKYILIGKQIKSIDKLIQERKIAAAEEILKKILKEARFFDLYSLVTIINEKLKLCTEIEELNKKIISTIRDREDMTFNQLFFKVEEKMEELKSIIGYFETSEGYMPPKEKQAELTHPPSIELLLSEPKPAIRKRNKS